MTKQSMESKKKYKPCRECGCITTRITSKNCYRCGKPITSKSMESKKVTIIKRKKEKHV